MRDPSAKLSWNRVSREVRYKSLPKKNSKSKRLEYVDNPALDISFVQRNGKFIINGINVLTNGHSSRDLQNKIESVSKLVNNKYKHVIK